MMIDQTVTMLGGEKCRHPPWFESLQNREQRPPKREQLGATLGARRYNAGGRPRNEMPAQSTDVCTSVNIHEHRWRNERDLNPRGVNPSAFKADAFGRSAIVPTDTLSRIRSHVRRYLAGDVESVSTISDLGLR
jgi:hypothetical protein